jgi:hypothetical protein
MDRPLTSYNVSSDNLLLINILNGMYNDNLRQIEQYGRSITNLSHDNSRIRKVIVSVLHQHNQPNNRQSTNNNRQSTNNNRQSTNNNRQSTNNNRQSTNNNRQTTNNNNRQTTNNIPIISTRFSNNTFSNSVLGTSSELGRVMLNNRPYIIDSFQHFTIPSTIPSTSNRTSSIFSDTLRNFYEPVNIYPTQSQIDTATRRVRYSDIIIPRNRSCPISIVDFNDSDIVTMIHHCGHVFHTDELNMWFDTHCTCPVCRFDIRDTTINSSNVLGVSTPEYTEEHSQEIIEERNDTDNIDNTETQTVNTSSNTNTSRQTANIISNLLNTFDLQDIDIIISDLSNNVISSPDPYTLFSMISNINNRNYQ